MGLEEMQFIFTAQCISTERDLKILMVKKTMNFSYCGFIG